MSAQPYNINEGIVIEDNYYVGKAEDNVVVGVNASFLIYETGNFTWVGGTIGTLKLIVQCSGDLGGVQASELLITKQYGGTDVYQIETPRATSGIGTVNFLSSYDEFTNSINVYAETYDEQVWSIRVIPLAVKSFSNIPPNGNG
jgi:hypothetical protein